LCLLEDFQKHSPESVVSPELTAEIERSFEALQNQKLEIHDYSPPLSHIVFEIYTADSFVAGIASKLLDRDPVRPEERVVVESPLMIDGRWWQCDDGELFDLQAHPEVRETAMAIEDLRVKCKAALGP
jgi:hypothetical protein